MKNFMFELVKCILITIVLCGLAVCAVVLMPIEIYAQYRRRYG